MRKGSKLEMTYDGRGHSCIRLTKKVGKMSIDELREALYEYTDGCGGWFGLVINCNDEWFDDHFGTNGDEIIAYDAELMMNMLYPDDDCEPKRISVICPRCGDVHDVAFNNYKE